MDADRAAMIRKWLHTLHQMEQEAAGINDELRPMAAHWDGLVNAYNLSGGLVASIMRLRGWLLEALKEEEKGK